MKTVLTRMLLAALIVVPLVAAAADRPFDEITLDLQQNVKVTNWEGPQDSTLVRIAIGGDGHIKYFDPDFRDPVEGRLSDAQIKEAAAALAAFDYFSFEDYHCHDEPRGGDPAEEDRADALYHEHMFYWSTAITSVRAGGKNKQIVHDRHCAADTPALSKFESDIEAIAAEWLSAWERAEAEKGNPVAELWLWQHHGENNDADRDEAFKWVQRAAGQGDAEALFLVGQGLYDQGDFGGALAAFKQAAGGTTNARSTYSDGPEGARCKLGDMYSAGQGADADHLEAAKWWSIPPDKLAALERRAAGGADGAAENDLGELYVASTCSRVFWSILPSVAMEWFRKAAEHGVADAQNKLGRAYELGYGGVTEDPASAVSWYRKAAEQGQADAEYNLGMMLKKDDPATRQEGIAWLRKAEAQGHKGAIDYFNNRAMDIPPTSGYEVLVVNLFFAVIAIFIFFSVKEKPLREYLTKKMALNAFFNVGIIGATLLTMVYNPSVQAACDAILIKIFYLRTFLPDSLEDNPYVLAAMLMSVVYIQIWIVATLLNRIFRALWGRVTARATK